MKYSKEYLDIYFNTIMDYHSKVELLSIAYSEVRGNKNDLESNLNWIIELSEVMNWQAMSDRSGVWTYYEVVDPNSAQVLIESLNHKKEKNIFDIYISGMGKYDNEILMDAIDTWIRKNENKIFIYIENILIDNKDWFYNIN
jgi:hypothetical protein